MKGSRDLGRMASFPSSYSHGIPIPMHKSILLALALTVFATFLVKQSCDALGIDSRPRPSLAAAHPTLPSLELRWSDAGSRNRVSFTPAPAFLFFIGSIITIGIASMVSDHLRSA